MKTPGFDVLPFVTGARAESKTPTSLKKNWKSSKTNRSDLTHSNELLICTKMSVECNHICDSSENTKDRIAIKNTSGTGGQAR